jgi:hypothetical protein
VGLGQDGLIRIPFLITAKNHLYEFDGAPHKMGGTSKLNSAALDSGEEVRGIYDFWRMPAGTPTQKFLCHTGTKVLESDGDGTFSNLITGLVDNAIPHYNTFDDIVIITSDAAATDAPQKWDQSGATSALGTNTPLFSFSETHKNRLWAAGVDSQPSRLYYSPDLSNSGPDGDWNHATSGTIDIDPGDGDRITAIKSFRNELWVFKGPYKGSIHRITGSAPTGSDGFARTTFVRGIGAVHQNSVFNFRDDIGYVWSDGSVNSLIATDQFGDFTEAQLSRPIRRWIEENVVFSRLDQTWSATDESRNIVLIALVTSGNTFPSHVICMDYRFDPVRWSFLEALGDNNAAVCVARVVDANNNNKVTMLTGGTDGFIRKLFQSSRNIDTSNSYNMRATSPFMNYSDPFTMKTLYSVALGVRASGGGDVTFGWQGDGAQQQTQTVSQGGGGFLLDTSLLDGPDLLAANTYRERYMSLETGGEFRSIQYELRNGNLNEDLDVSNLAVKMKFKSESLENN